MKMPKITRRLFPPPALSDMGPLNGHRISTQNDTPSSESLDEARQLERAWGRLDQAIEEIEDKDRVINDLQKQLRQARRSSRKKTVSPLDPLQIGKLVSDVEREHIDWVWPGRLALGKLTILDGDPGLGKSTLLYNIAARITTGSPMPDGTPSERGGVLILSTEDGIGDTIRPRLEAASADLTRCLVVQSIPETDGPGRVPVLPGDLPSLEYAARRVEARLLIIDPLMAHLGGETNSYRDQDVRRALAPVSEFAERCGLAVVVVRHLNKTSSGSPLYRGGGSIGIIGAARVGLLVGGDPHDTDRLVLASTKNNLARMPQSLAFRVVSAPADPETSTIMWEGACSLSASDLLSAPGESTNTTAVDEAIDWLEGMLVGGPRPATELYAAAEEAGLSKHVLQRARSRVADSYRSGGLSSKGFWMWCLRTPDAPKSGTKNAKNASSDTCHLSHLSVPVFQKGQWVRTPKGEGRVLQAFANQITVHIADKALLFAPEDVQLIEKGPTGLDSAIVALKQAEPKLSNRQIARRLKTNHVRVGRVLARAVEQGETDGTPGTLVPPVPLGTNGTDGSSVTPGTPVPPVPGVPLGSNDVPVDFEFDD